ncbi:Rotatin [Folsomia candida]|uniref:Rotatin n=2 Tax=Folsomia candida TaxID=158441 RepID=A0A226F0X0_FOLCA|nr:Rotatin [Folsomia candida]
MLLDSFALTVCKYAYTFPIDYKMLSLGLQEVLLDLAYCYEKHGQDINSTVLAMCFASIMKTIQVNDEVFILAYDIRQCVRKLSRCPLLSNGWPEVHKYFVQYSSPLVDSLSSDPDVPNTRGFEDSFQLEPNQKQFYFQPQEAISKLLIAIQNATGHQTVILAIDNLWGYILPLAVNQRWKNGAMDYICQEVPFRDSFYRFLCVEPTCVEDEDLLIRVINLIAYLFANLSTGREKLEEWIVPLCMENGSAFQKLLRTYCLKSDITDVFAGTVLPDTLRSLFDFLFVILKKTEPNPSYAEYKWNIFHTLCLILHKLGDLGFSFSVVLQPILRGIASLSCVNDVTAQLAQNPKFCVALILRLTEFIIFLQEQSSGLSSESFRNQGALYYSSLSLYHVLLISFEIEAPPNSDWIGPCCAVIPCLWDSRTSKVRTLGYQISEVISRRIQGIVALMTVSESPDRIWTSCYNALINFEEPAIVKLHAAHTLYNLLLLWDDIERSTEIGKSLQLPTTWSVLDEFTKLLSHVYWLPTLSEVFGNKAVEDSTMTDEDNSNPQLITPKVLTVLCKIVIKMKTSLLPPFHPEPFSGIICSSGLCAMLFRLVGTNSMSQILEASWWIDSCSALSSVLESLISLCEIDRGISLILIGDKHSMISLIQLLALQPPSGCKLNLADETLSTLWVNVFTLLTILCTDSGNNFEDFERCISNQRNIIFVRLTEWLKSDALAVCRKMALTFLHEILSKLQFKQEEKEADNFQAGGHPILCRVWNEKNMTYGSSLVDRLVSIYEESSTHEEKLIILRTFNALINISESAKITATQRGVVNILILKLKYFAHKYHNVSETFHQMKKFQGNYQWLDETATILSVISSLVYKNPDGKKSALSNEVVDTFHKIFKWWKAYPDRTLLHGFVETLLNFTEEFPPGCQALTFTTNVLGVGPRKAPSGQSILSEIFEILQAELNLAESCNLKTVELLFEFLKNASFVMECRTMLTKSTIILFLINLHTSEIKKWSPKQHRVKLLYLEFLLHLSIHPDMQTAIAKVPEAIDIFVLLVDQGDDMTSVLALQVLRNLSFQAMNRTRLLCEDAVMPCLSSKLSESDHPKEMECAAVAVWALIANSEKGKLSAKKSLCPIAVQKTITRLRKLEQSSNDLLTKKQDLSNLINILTNISNLLGSSPST